MSNEVVNPFQTYRDNKGAVLAGGSLRILQPGTAALGTAFSDSDLTIPQVVDGYGLDNFGRVQGNLRWAGLRDVEVFGRGSPPAFIRTDPNVVTLIDSSVFAINFPSVAAMIADTTLVDGDVAETQSYNLAQRQGGARYLVTVSALSVDNYRVHDLAPAGLQAQLLDEEAHNNFYVAGAIGDGVAEDTLPVQRVFDIGGDIECANGVFACAGLTLSVNARIYGNGTLLRVAFSNVDLITLTGIDLFITFDGLLVDGNLANQSAVQAIAIVRSSITASAGTTISLITFNNVQFQNASQNDVAGVGDDTGFPVLYTFSQCDFLGGEEGAADGTFDPASVLLTEGVNASFEDCYFDPQAAPTVGRPAIVTSNSTFVNPGYLSVVASTFVLMGMEATLLSDSLACIHARELINLQIGGNRILAPLVGGIVFGAEVDTVTITDNLVDAVSSSAVVFGGIVSLVTLAATPGDNWLIDENTIPTCAGVAILLDGASAGVDASNVQVSNNIIDSPLLGAIHYGSLIDLSLQDNYVNMNDVAAINAFECLAAIAGQIDVEGNELVNLANSIALLDILSTAANYTVDGNTVDDATDGFTLTGMLDVFITNNVLNELSGDLITVGSLDNCRIDGNSYVGVTVPTTFAQNTGAITSLVVGLNFWAQVDASITEIAVAGVNQSVGPVEAHHHLFTVTGVSSIDTITDPGIDGFMVVLQADAGNTLAINDGLGNVNLGAATRDLDDVTDTLALIWNETNSEWNELAFSDN